MTTHIILRIGQNDTTPSPLVKEKDVCIEMSLGKTGIVSEIGSDVRKVLAQRGLNPPPLCIDLLNLAQTIYSADNCILRKTGYESWSRDIAVYIPVSNPELWRRQNEIIVDMLSFLTGDHWTFHFRTMESEPVEKTKGKVSKIDPLPNAVSLLSGGLDSFIGAIDRLESGEPTAFVGHHGFGSTNKAQKKILPVLEKHYPGKVFMLPFYVQQPAFPNMERENTTRSRSILFLALGTAVAASLGAKVPLLVPENGLISINRPLTSTRMGSYSTRTTHPYYISQFRKLLDGLGISIEVQLPYQFHTKGEMATGVLGKAAFKEGWASTISCSHPEVGRYRKKSPGQHCGYCVPCIIRRASLAAVNLDDPAHYLEDVVASGQTWKSSRPDLRCFTMSAKQFESIEPQQMMFAVMESGPIPPDEIDLYTGVYRRGMEEVRQFLGVTSGVPV